MTLVAPTNVAIKNLFFTEADNKVARRIEENEAIAEVRRAVNVWTYENVVIANDE